MNILYIHQYFKTPDIPGGTRSYWNSLELIKNGHNVTVIRYDKTIEKSKERRNINGIDVISIKIQYSQYMGILARLQAFLSFMFLSTKVALKEKDIDLVIATSTPLTIGFPALILKKFKKIPYIFEVRDLWPEVPIQMGAIKNRLIIKITRWFEKTIYNNSQHIIALSPGMKDGVLATGIFDKKVTMIPNMAKIDKFFPRPNDSKTISDFNIKPDTFKIIYFGALGEANAIDYVLDAAKLLKDEKDIEFLFIGYGPKTPLIEETIKEFHLGNIHYLGVFNMETTSNIVNLCDVSLVTFSNLPILSTNSPNKLFDSLSAGKPIIVNSPGWTKTLVEENNCGVFADPTLAQDLAEKICYLKSSPKICEEMGRNSRILAETEYDKSILCKKFAKVVNDVENNLKK